MDTKQLLSPAYNKYRRRVLPLYKEKPVNIKKAKKDVIKYLSEEIKRFVLENECHWMQINIGNSNPKPKTNLTKKSAQYKIFDKENDCKLEIKYNVE